MRQPTVLLLVVALGAAARVLGFESSDADFNGVAFEWDYEEESGMDTYGERRGLLAYDAPGRVGFFIRATVNNNKANTCSRFWALSEPGGSRNPSRAYRQATRDQVNQVTTDMSLGDSQLRTLRLICRENRMIGDTIQRKILRVEAIAAIAPDLQADYNSRMLSYTRSGAWLGDVCATLGGTLRDLDRWCPQRAQPVNPPELS